MSEAALTKIQKDCAKLEAELAVYKNSQSVAQACEAIITYVNSQPEPFSANKNNPPNPWHSGTNANGGCIIS